MDFSLAVSSQLAKALTGTFVYSLWQGLVLAAAAGLIILLTRRSAPRLRYNLLASTLLLFTVAVVITFVWQLQLHEISGFSGAAEPDLSASVLSAGNPVIKSATAVQTEVSLLAYINRHAEMIVLIWFLMVGARCLQLLAGIHGIHRLKHQEISVVSAEWRQRVVELARDLGIQKAIRIVESGLAEVPMVIGHLKPVILIPAGLITALPPAQLEAILLHELAHIRRKDYLVNLLQNFVEIIFFFNPAVLWISSLIRAERENCCDDITLSKTNNKATYIHALLTCQEHQGNPPRLAMALGQRGHLLGRVNRMVSSYNHSLSVLEKTLLSVCLLSGVWVLAAFNKADEAAAPPQQVETAVPLRVSDQTVSSDSSLVSRPLQPKIFKPSELGEGTSFMSSDIVDHKSTRTYLFKEQGILYQINFLEAAMTSLRVNGRLIPAAEWTVYEKTVDQLISEHDRSLGPVSRPPAEIAAFAPVPELPEKKAAGTTFQQSLSAIDQAGEVLDRAIDRLKTDTSKPYKSKTTYETTYQSRAAEYSTYYDGGKQIFIYDKVSGSVTNKASVNEKIAIMDLHQPIAGKDSIRTFIKSGVQRNVSSPERTVWPTTEELISWMVKEGIVSSGSEVKSFMISQSEMLLNGRELPAAIHQRILKENIRSGRAPDKWMILYNFDTSTLQQ